MIDVHPAPPWIFFAAEGVARSVVALINGTGKVPMSHTRLSVAVRVLMGALAVSLAGCSGIATKDIEASRAELHSDPLKMSAKGLPDASIDASGAVDIGPTRLALTDAQRGLTRAYRAAVVDLMDLTLSETSHLTGQAMRSAIFGMLIGREDQAEKHIEKRTEAMIHTPQFCSRLDSVRRQQNRMVQSVKTLMPYAKLSRQQVDDCNAGRPYQVNI